MSCLDASGAVRHIYIYIYIYIYMSLGVYGLTSKLSLISVDMHHMLKIIIINFIAAYLELQ
jgi:hypothetical protein